MHGAGGQGKTRLAMRFAELCAAEGWSVLHARHSNTIAPPATDQPDPADARGLLVVVDYGLVNLTHRHNDLRRLDRAAATGREAVELYRELAARRPAEFERDLAEALANLGAAAWNTGQRDESLRTAEEATRILRRLARTGRVDVEAGLAKSLWSFAAIRLAAGTRLPQARADLREAIDLFSGLAQGEPGAYEGQRRAALDLLARFDRPDPA
ncbi:hypothetical protein AB0K14_13210 [Actinosynnema sp. NPDC050801]|uniref:hypothetical protein n=1 Tax=unclassified Actinosynnema TaxID=2637065 RepID=UPI00340D7476